MALLLVLGHLVVAASPCVDSGSWHKTKAAEKDCSWVSEFTERCRAVGSDASGRVTNASLACPTSCGTCDATLERSSQGLRLELEAIERRAGAALDACGLTGAPRPVLVTCLDSYYGSSARPWASYSKKLGWEAGSHEGALMCLATLRL